MKVHCTTLVLSVGGQQLLEATYSAGKNEPGTPNNPNSDIQRCLIDLSFVVAAALVLAMLLDGIVVVGR